MERHLFKTGLTGSHGNHGKLVVCVFGDLGLYLYQHGSMKTACLRQLLVIVLHTSGLFSVQIDWDFGFRFCFGIMWARKIEERLLKVCCCVVGRIGGSWMSKVRDEHFINPGNHGHCSSPMCLKSSAETFSENR